MEITTLRLNSDDRPILADGSDCQFGLSIDRRSVNNINRLMVPYITLCNVFDNITELHNTFSVRAWQGDTPGGSVLTETYYTITIPPGQYTTDEFVVAFNTASRASRTLLQPSVINGFPFDISFTGYQFTLEEATSPSNLNRLWGFRIEDRSISSPVVGRSPLADLMGLRLLESTSTPKDLGSALILPLVSGGSALSPSAFNFAQIQFNLKDGSTSNVILDVGSVFLDFDPKSIDETLTVINSYIGALVTLGELEVRLNSMTNRIEYRFFDVDNSVASIQFVATQVDVDGDGCLLWQALGFFDDPDPLSAEVTTFETWLSASKSPVFLPTLKAQSFANFGYPSTAYLHLREGCSESVDSKRTGENVTVVAPIPLTEPYGSWIHYRSQEMAQELQLYPRRAMRDLSKITCSIRDRRGNVLDTKGLPVTVMLKCHHPPH